LKAFGVRSIAITERSSSLARDAELTLDGWVAEEACPHDLAPTTSTTAALVLGDALAVALLEYKGFKREDFARLHPGGALGRKLVTRVEEIMLREELPVMSNGATMRDAIMLIAERRGIAIMVDGANVVLGILTAGDLSRLMEREGDLRSIDVVSVLTRTPKMARLGELASAVVYRMEQFGIMVMPVVDGEGRLSGVVHLHDLMRARLA
jgi:arabinose-5-phosphate isomerase